MSLKTSSEPAVFRNHCSKFTYRFFSSFRKSLQNVYKNKIHFKVIFYSADIFISIGLDSQTWAVYGSILIALVETIMHGITMFIIDQWGRRLLLIIGMLGMSFCCFVLAVTRIFSVIYLLFLL